MLPIQDTQVIANGLRFDMNKRNVIGDTPIYVEFNPDGFNSKRSCKPGDAEDYTASPDVDTYVRNRILAGFFTVEDVLSHFGKDRVFLVMNKDRSYWSEDPFAD